MHPGVHAWHRGAEPSGLAHPRGVRGARHPSSSPTPAARRPGRAESGGLPSGWQSQGCWQGARTRASLPPVAAGRATAGPAERLAKKADPSGICGLMLSVCRASAPSSRAGTCGEGAFVATSTGISSLPGGEHRGVPACPFCPWEAGRTLWTLALSGSERPHPLPAPLAGRGTSLICYTLFSCCLGVGLSRD